MTIEVSTNVIIEVLKPVCIFIAGVVTEVVRRWFSASQKDRDEFIDASSEALEDGRITLKEGYTIIKEGNDIFIGIDPAILTDDTQDDMGKA